MVLKVSVAGVRGDINVGLTPDVILNMSLAYGTYMKKRTIIIGTDTRPTRELVKNLTISALLATGCSVIDIGIAPTPVVAFMVKHLKAAGGIVVSASHNDIQYNALKLLKKGGIFLNKEEGNEVYEIYINKKFDLVSYSEIKKVKNLNSASETFVENLINTFRNYVNFNEIKNLNLKIVMDAVNGAGSVTNSIFFNKLGIKNVQYLNDSTEKAFPRSPEPIKKNLKDLEETLKKMDFDIAFVQDPDADRLGILTPKRMFISEEITLPIAMLGILDHINTPVVINIATSLYNDHIVGKKKKILRSPVGEANVVEKMLESNSIIGGEGNGGVIFAPFHYGRDSYVGMILIMNTLAKTGKSIDEVANMLPTYYMFKEKLRNFQLNDEFKKELKLHFYKGIYRFDDGIYYSEKSNEGDYWFLLRESNTEPIVRYQIESSSERLAKQITKKIKQLIA